MQNLNIYIILIYCIFLNKISAQINWDNSPENGNYYSQSYSSSSSSVGNGPTVTKHTLHSTVGSKTAHQSYTTVGGNVIPSSYNVHFDEVSNEYPRVDEFSANRISPDYSQRNFDVRHDYSNYIENRVPEALKNQPYYPGIVPDVSQPTRFRYPSNINRPNEPVQIISVPNRPFQSLPMISPANRPNEAVPIISAPNRIFQLPMISPANRPDESVPITSGPIRPFQNLPIISRPNRPFESLPMISPANRLDEAVPIMSATNKPVAQQPYYSQTQTQGKPNLSGPNIISSPKPWDLI